MADDKTYSPFPFLSGVLQSRAQKTAETVQLACICSRPLQDVLCRVCGLIFTARVRKQCPVHPSAIHLMDYEHCPKCKNTHLHEFRASLTPQKKSPTVSSLDEILKTPVKIPQSVDRLKATGMSKLSNSPMSLSANVRSNRDQMEDLGLSERR